jgi:hypothetical protein
MERIETELAHPGAISGDILPLDGTAPKNLFDTLTIVDRSRGALPGPQRILQAGMSYAF